MDSRLRSGIKTRHGENQAWHAIITGRSAGARPASGHQTRLPQAGARANPDVNSGRGCAGEIKKSASPTRCSVTRTNVASRPGRGSAGRAAGGNGFGGRAPRRRVRRLFLAVSVGARRPLIGRVRFGPRCYECEDLEEAQVSLSKSPSIPKKTVLVPVPGQGQIQRRFGSDTCDTPWWPRGGADRAAIVGSDVDVAAVSHPPRRVTPTCASNAWAMADPARRERSRSRPVSATDASARCSWRGRARGGWRVTSTRGP